MLEIIAYQIPAFVSRLPSTEEYLGKEYPMFYTDVAEVQALLDDEVALARRITEAWEYLRNMDKSHMSFERFAEAIQRVVLEVYAG